MFLAFLGLVAALCVAGYFLRFPLTRVLVTRLVTENLNANLFNSVQDGLHVALCGAGSPLPDPKRVGPCVAVMAGTQLFIVDAGSGSSLNLRNMGMSPGDIDGILLTHFHSDHIDGLGEMLLQRWAAGGHVRPTPVYGPPGVEQVVAGFNQAYAQDSFYRVAHHGEQAMPLSGRGATAEGFRTPGAGVGVMVLEQGDLRVTAFTVDHKPVSPAVGYRFDYKDRSLVVSGDTSKSVNLEEFAAGVDLLVHEALSPSLLLLLNQAARDADRSNLAKITADIPTYHASPVEVAEVARDAGVQALLYYHIIPPLIVPTMEQMFLKGVSEIYGGFVVVGRDGTLVSLPTGLTVVDWKELL